MERGFQRVISFPTIYLKIQCGLKMNFVCSIKKFIGNLVEIIVVQQYVMKIHERYIKNAKDNNHTYDDILSREVHIF